MGKIIAFIPARGGSKSIPLKNVKPFCGKPLIYWNIAALDKVPGIDEVIIATDSDEIIMTVQNFKFGKVTFYRRSKENATDTASTESVILEYIQSEQPSDDTTFILVQATSPLTETAHFEEGLSLYRDGNYDSLLTCVRQKRFFWNADGTSKNYDFRNRPRRQNFAGELMENGAFYISSIKNIKLNYNRLGGNIGIYEMPEHTSYEIDEPEDWIIMEHLFRRYCKPALLEAVNKNNIKLFLTDVDGVLTDAGMYYSENGEELKKFNTHDGMAFQLLRERGIKTGIITSENTKIVERRAAKLKADYLHQGKRSGGKLEAAKDICLQEGISLNEVAYVGDDINCLDLLVKVGIAACPSSATQQIKNIPGILHLDKKGGDGAVREFAEYILNSGTYLGE